MRACILAAGKGTRIGSFGGALHKSLLPLGNLAVLSHIVAQFPADTDFVIAVGHLETQVRNYLLLAHPDRRCTFVIVRPYEGHGAGPGRSLWSCRDLLQEPFYLTACDTLVTEMIPPLDRNFMGTHPVEDPSHWCTVETNVDGQIRALYYKRPDGTKLGFVGFAGIVDTTNFWRGLGEALEQGEPQVDPGFVALIDNGITSIPMRWIDTGTDVNYQAALPRYTKNYTFYGKSTDVTYSVDDRIVKFFSDERISAARFRRGRDNPAFAKVLDQRGGFFSYKFVEGQPLSQIIGRAEYSAVLHWLGVHFWHDMPVDRARFQAACQQFYEEKTRKRLATYLLTQAPDMDGRNLSINGTNCRPVSDALGDLPPRLWMEALPSRFHGDLHDENIIIQDDGGYRLIDWREDFAGLESVGDRYYDLAKFFHTLDLAVATMSNGAFHIDVLEEASIRLSHDVSVEQMAAQRHFWEFIATNGYDVNRIEVLNGLIFLNMAPLYAKPMADYLYLLGRLRLEEALLQK